MSNHATIHGIHGIHIVIYVIIYQLWSSKGSEGNFNKVGWVGPKVLSRPLTDSLAVERRQKILFRKVVVLFQILFGGRGTSKFDGQTFNCEV
jgi:hypothetical protein